MQKHQIGWIIDLNVKDQRVKVLEDDIQKYFHNLEGGKDFLSRRLTMKTTNCKRKS